MKKIPNILILVFIMLSLIVCNTTDENKKISVTGLVFSRITPYNYEVNDKSGFTTIGTLEPNTIYKIVGNRIILFKRGDSGEDSSFTGSLDEAIIKEINRGLKIIDYKNKNEENFIDSVKYNEEKDYMGGGYIISTSLIPYLHLEYENKIKYYKNYNHRYFKKRYLKFIDFLSDIEKRVNLEYLKDTTVLKTEREKITGFYSHIKLKSTIKYTPPNIKKRKGRL